MRHRTALLLAALVLLPACSGPNTNSAGSTGSGSCDTSDRTVAYRELPGVPVELTSLDLYPVAGRCDAPVIVWVHGGGYSRGDKSNAMADKVRWARSNGWMLVSVNYRLSDAAAEQPARYPDHYQDVAEAIAWITESVADHGGDPQRIALLGHSAGADIVANVAVDPQYLRSAGLEPEVLDCVGPLDTEGFDKVTSNGSGDGDEKDMWLSALGNLENYEELTSASLLIEAGTAKTLPPMIGVVRGTPLRQGIEQRFLDVVAATGTEAIAIDARSLTHAAVNRTIGQPGDQVMTPPLTSFLTSCLDTVDKPR